ncbi:MAG: MFS transporter [Atribacterota bacterium]|nr:MFS transporter [Atribacterota bacterium]
MLKNNKNLPLKINALGHAYNDAYYFIIPLLLPFFRLEFSFSYFQSGLILTFHEALRSIFSLLFGSFADRYGHKHLIISLGFITSSLLLGSVIWLNNTAFIIGALLLMAISVATFHPLATAMVGEKAKPGKQGRDLSLFSAAGTFGLVIMSLLFGWLVQIWGWRLTCLIIALPGFCLGLLYTKIKEEKTKKEIISNKTNHGNLFIIFFLSRGILCLGTKVFLSFLPTYTTDHIGLKPGISAWIISIYFAGVFMGSLLVGQLLDHKKPLAFSIFSTISISILIFLFTYSRSLLLVGILVAGIGLMEGIYFPSQNTWLTMSSSNNNRNSLFGFGFFIEGLSATIAPTIYGWVADHFGLVYAYRLTTIPIFISFILYILLYQMVEKQEKQSMNISSAQ